MASICAVCKIASVGPFECAAHVTEPLTQKIAALEKQVTELQTKLKRSNDHCTKERELSAYYRELHQKVLFKYETMAAPITSKQTEPVTVTLDVGGKRVKFTLEE